MVVTLPPTHSSLWFCSPKLSLTICKCCFSVNHKIGMYIRHFCIIVCVCLWMCIYLPADWRVFSLLQECIYCASVLKLMSFLSNLWLWHSQSFRIMKTLPSRPKAIYFCVCNPSEFDIQQSREHEDLILGFNSISNKPVIKVKMLIFLF